MDEVEQLKKLLRYQESVDIVCPDCDAHITNEVVLRKRKREAGPSTSRAAEEGLDEIPIALRDQNTHDLICPVCECLVTRDLILRKRKREFSDDEAGEWESWGYARGLSSEDSDQDDQLGDVLRAQTTHDIICPDCEAPVTRDVILERRRRKSNEGAWGSRKERAKLKEIVIQKDAEEERAESEVLLKGYRAATSEEIRHFQEEKRSHTLTCPGCKFPIPYEALLQQRSDIASKGSLEEIIAHRESRKKENPWKARYERDFEKELPRTTVDPEEEEEAAQTRVATYGNVANKSLTEPLLPIEASSPRQPTTISFQSESVETIAWDLLYFVFLMILWMTWYLLHQL